MSVQSVKTHIKRWDKALEKTHKFLNEAIASIDYEKGNVKPILEFFKSFKMKGFQEFNAYTGGAMEWPLDQKFGVENHIIIPFIPDSGINKYSHWPHWTFVFEITSDLMYNVKDFFDRYERLFGKDENTTPEVKARFLKGFMIAATPFMEFLEDIKKKDRDFLCELDNYTCIKDKLLRAIEWTYGEPKSGDEIVYMNNKKQIVRGTYSGTSKGNYSRGCYVIRTEKGTTTKRPYECVRVLDAYDSTTKTPEEELALDLVLMDLKIQKFWKDELQILEGE